ncbi:Acetyl-CoA carboxylase biotin carboxylase subunit [Sulfidibacter corallicola]|uniref:Acetyl-CoA carboxylase biotin carboxylase subunit n=1 Tax=Sulfidibacter corallicola TaxID=2818388 RepID=A0A8A4TK07_SULCO|nr:acetyl-CoA carboxylase biotin carboxylase subunit [Sulfidibacter corallicola]QTD49880.1 acetyl-CoA carboxylase biotin carboxylase subunit [Sulfidibacter corallicola]
MTAPTTPFSKILIANRGEISVRIARAARQLGHRTVAVYSEVDREAPHVAAADEAVSLEVDTPSGGYLDIEAVVAAAQRTGADAVHPGYGFLAENPAFAEACARAGLVFIGPGAEAIRLMGNKRIAKERMVAAGVPCVPGRTLEGSHLEAVRSAAEELGYPVMIKAAAGGGGRGMRLVGDAAELAEALDSARSEAENAFGDGELILEKAIVGGRHVEIQVVADRNGKTLHLGERDCSVQRRHQKVIEEAPSPAVDTALRSRMGEAAIAAARAVGYVGLGTVEFLLDGEGRFYFLEMNTRLQVEHPVTELVTGIDLVALQIDIAAGRALPMEQRQVALQGHALEVRLYAEDPAAGYLPQTGRVLRWHPCGEDFVRIDHALAEGMTVSPHYDPMLAKIIVHGTDRREALARMRRALSQTHLLGVRTNRAFLSEVLDHETFAAGTADTSFLANAFTDARRRAQEPSTQVLGLAALAWRQRAQRAAGIPAELGGWISANAPLRPCRIRVRDTVYEIATREVGDDALEVISGEAVHRFRWLDARDGLQRYRCDGVDRRVCVAFEGEAVWISDAQASWRCEDVSLVPPAKSDETGGGQVTAVMSGRVARVAVEAGQAVQAGETVVVLEAMKMEHRMCAGASGRIKAVHVAVDQQVADRQLLVEIEADEAES